MARSHRFETTITLCTLRGLLCRQPGCATAPQPPGQAAEPCLGAQRAAAAAAAGEQRGAAPAAAAATATAATTAATAAATPGQHLLLLLWARARLGHTEQRPLHLLRRGRARGGLPGLARPDRCRPAAPHLPPPGGHLVPQRRGGASYAAAAVADGQWGAQVGSGGVAGREELHTCIWSYITGMGEQGLRTMI